MSGPAKDNLGHILPEAAAITADDGFRALRGGRAGLLDGAAAYRAYRSNRRHPAHSSALVRVHHSPLALADGITTFFTSAPHKVPVIS